MANPITETIAFLSLVLAIGFHAEATLADETVVELTDRAIRESFENVHEGFSSDELIVDERLFVAFMAELGMDPQDASSHATQNAAALRLLKLRKSGKLNVKTLRSRREDVTAIIDTAELAIRTVLDRHGVSIDQVLCDPVLRDELQSEAEAISPGVASRLVRKAVLKLRKVRRLRPELVLRVAQWQTEVRTESVADLVWETVPESPGIYLFRSDEGYLYIGEAMNLRDRMQQHLLGSHNSGLAGVLSDQRESLTLELHIFGKDSPGKQVAMRRAYESELIRSREPKFNLRP